MAQEKLELERMPATGGAIEAAAPRYPSLAGYTNGSSYGYGYPEDDGRIHLLEIWRTIRKRRWLIATIVVIATTIVTIEMFRVKTTYQASTMIEIGKESQPANKAGGMLIQDESDNFYPLVRIKTHMLELKSRPLLADVITRLRLEQRSDFLAVDGRKSFWAAVKSIGARSSAERNTEDSTPSIDSPQPGESQQAGSEAARLSPLIKVLDKNLTVEPIRDTRVIKVTFTHTDPVIAAEVANAVSESFIARSFRTKAEKYNNAASWLDRSTRELQAKVQQAEQALANYTRDHNIYSTEGKETLTTDKLSRLHDQVIRVETDRLLKGSLYDELNQGRLDQLGEAFSDPKLNELKKGLGELSSAYALMSARYGPENPRVVEIKKQMAEMDAQIRTSRSSLEAKLKGDYERAVRDERSLKGALDRAKVEATRQNQDAIQYGILKQDVDTNKSLYTEFLQKTNQANLELAQQSSALHVIEPAEVPTAPVDAKRLQGVSIAFFVSLCAGLIFAFFLEYLDNTIKTVDDVSRFVRLPALGVIPMIAKPQGRLSAKKRTDRTLSSAGSAPNPVARRQSEVLEFESNSSAAEAYRVLRTSVLLSAAGCPPRTILVTSGQAGEGKTTTVVNTAVALSQLGASVLIIDCDMRRPATHKVFDVENSRGLSTYLSRDEDIEPLIQRLSLRNLSLLPCGPIPPNPAELISSDKMKHLLAAMAERYDHVLIDSPPLINVTDPIILSTLVDGVVLVIHGGQSARDVVRRARQELVNAGAKIFGVVLNNVDMRQHKYDDYYYYYQRNYEGYGGGLAQ